MKNLRNFRTAKFTIVDYMVSDFVQLSDRCKIKHSEKPSDDFTEIKLSASTTKLRGFSGAWDKRKQHFEPVFYYPSIIDHGKNSNK